MNENQRIWKLYRYTCKHNELIYIGITSKTLDERWANGHGYTGNPRLNNAIKKYGTDGFIREILLDEMTQQEAFEKEIEYIAKFHATEKDIGYNIAIGGTAPMTGRHHSEETKKLFSETRIGEGNSFFGKHHSDKTKEILSEANKGRKHTDEWKRGQSERSKLWHQTHDNPMLGDHRFVGENNPMYGVRGGKHPAAVKVAKFSSDGELLEVFNSTTEAAQSIGAYNGAHITECCKGRRKKCGGYIWKYFVNEQEEEE